MYSFHQFSKCTPSILHQTVSHFSYVKVYRTHVCNHFRLHVVHIRPSVLLDMRLKFSKRQTIGRAPGGPSQLLFISVYRHAHTFQIHKYLLSATIEIRNVILVHLYRHCSGFILHDYLLVDITRFIVSCDVCSQYPIIGDFYRRFLRSILTAFLSNPQSLYSHWVRHIQVHSTEEHHNHVHSRSTQRQPALKKENIFWVTFISVSILIVIIFVPFSV